MDWTAEQLELKNSIINLAEALNENYLCQEKHAEFSFKNWQLIKDIGIIALPIHRKHGGLEQNILTTMLILETLGNCCEDAGLNFVVASHIANITIPIQIFGTDDQQAKYLPCLCSGNKIGAHTFAEAGSITDAFSKGTWAIKNDQGYLLNGRKVFISCPLADLFVVYACTKNNSFFLDSFSAFLVDRSTPGLKIGHPIEKMGLRTAPLCELYFDNCQLSSYQLLGQEGQGVSIFNYVTKWAALCFFAIHLGEMAHLVSKCIEYYKFRNQYSREPIFKFQSIAHKIVNMKIGLESARTLLYKTGNKFQQGKNTNVNLAITKVAASENYVRAALEAIQIFCAYGYIHETGIEKHLRNAIASTIYSGTVDTVASIIGLFGPESYKPCYDQFYSYLNDL